METTKINKVMSSIVLTCLVSMAIFLFTRLEWNKLWFEKVTSYWDAYKEQKDSDASLEDIKIERLGISYKLSKDIEQTFRQKKVKNPTILFEPNSYLEQSVGFKMPEPIVFYYYTGLKSVWMNSKNVNEATHLIRLKDGRMFIDSISSPEVLKQILDQYKSYTPAL
jgi:hypothetical protein